MHNLFKTITLLLIVFSTNILIGQDKVTVDKEIKEHTIGRITFESKEYIFIKTVIRKTKDGFLSIDRLQNVRLYDVQADEKTYQQYGFTGPQGDYLVEITAFAIDGSSIDEQHFVKIIGDLPPPPGPTPPGPTPPGPDPNPPGPGPDPVPPVPPAPTPDIPTDEYNNLAIRINAIAPSVMRAEYSSEWFGLADEIADNNVLRTSDAQRKAIDIITRYNNQGWVEVNNLIKMDSITRNMNITELENYYRAIAIGCRGRK